MYILKKQSKLITLLLIALFLNLTAYSQTLVLSRDGKTFSFTLPPNSILFKTDTLIGFSIPQSKFLLKEHYRANMLAQKDSISILQLRLCDSVAKSSNRQSVICESLMKNREGEIAIYKYANTKLENALKQANKAIRRQKAYKVTAMVAGAAISGFLGYKYLTK